MEGGQEHSATSTDEQRGPSRKRSKSNHSNCEHKVRVRNGTYELLKNISGEEKVAMSAIIDELVQERTQRNKRGGDDGGKGHLDVGGFPLSVYQGIGNEGMGSASGGAETGTAQYILQLQQQIAGLEHKLESTVKTQQELVGALSQMQSRVEPGGGAQNVLQGGAGFATSSAHDAGGMNASAYRSGGNQQINNSGGGAQQRSGTADRPSPKPPAGQGSGVPGGDLQSWQLLLKNRGLGGSLGGASAAFGRDMSSLVVAQSHHRANAALASAMGLDQNLVAASFGAAGGLGVGLQQHLDVTSQLGALTGAAGGVQQNHVSNALDLQLLSRATAAGQMPNSAMHQHDNVDQ